MHNRYLLECAMPSGKLGYIEVSATGEIIEHGINDNLPKSFIMPKKDQFLLRALVDGESIPIETFTTNDTESDGQSGFELLSSISDSPDFVEWFLSLFACRTKH